MIELREAKIADGVPRIVAAQPWEQILSEVYSKLQNRVLDCLDTGVTFYEVDNCSEAMLDQMAVYLKVEWYDSTADVETKRKTIKTAIEIQRYAGTVKAVRGQVNTIYPDSEVKEWFEYGGTPGRWKLRVNITDSKTPVIYHTIAEMEKLLGYTKRLSAHLEQITYVAKPRTLASAHAAATPCRIASRYTVRLPDFVALPDAQAQAYAAGAVEHMRKTVTIKIGGSTL